jgi:hypothetical protein
VLLQGVRDEQQAVLEPEGAGVGHPLHQGERKGDTFSLPRTAHSAGSVLMRGFVPVGHRSPGALGF